MDINEAKRQKGLKYMALKMAFETPNETSKYLPAKPGALVREPLKAA